MRPRERILAALAHQEPDRVPLDVGGTDVTGINIEAYRALLPWLGLETPREIPVLDIVQQIANIDEAALHCLHAHCRGVFPAPGTTWQLKIEEDELASWFLDEWGITWKKPKPDGFYYDIARHPLKDAKFIDLDQYPWPDPTDPLRQKGLIETARTLHEQSEYAVILAGISGGGSMELGTWLAGFEDFFVLLLTDPNLADTLLDKALEIKLRFWQAVLPEASQYVDIVSESEDLGVQDRLMVSPRIFRRHIKPRLRQLISGIKATAPEIKVLLHSDGAISEIIPDLIEIGVDVLNPVQVSAKGMGDTAFLKKEFGKDLVFWGAIDTQHVLPFGAPQEVVDEVHRRIDDLAPGGGYVAAPVHNIQAGVPPKNILAMLDAWKRYGNGSSYIKEVNAAGKI
jgi:uroporphyrinogen decarboxylase